MFAREWKARCPKRHEDGFITYLYQTGVKETSDTPGFKGAQVFIRNMGDNIEITLLTYWESLNSIKAFSGEDIGVAKLYSEDEKYELDPDKFVLHYEVIENKWS